MRDRDYPYPNSGIDESGDLSELVPDELKNVRPFLTLHGELEAIGDPRFTTDPVYREEVQKRLRAGLYRSH